MLVLCPPTLAEGLGWEAFQWIGESSSLEAVKSLSITGVPVFRFDASVLFCYSCSLIRETIIFFFLKGNAHHLTLWEAFDGLLGVRYWEAMGDLSWYQIDEEIFEMLIF